MEEEKLLQERKEKILRLMKKDRLFSAFVIISLASFIFAVAVRLGVNFFINTFSPLTWILLAILSGVAAMFVFYNKKGWSFYPILAWIVYLAIKIRTGNLAGLRDVTTGGWTLGPDLDPFLFLRWAKHIVENGSLMAVDMMRYVPIGFETKAELILHPYMIAWFHKIAVLFGSESVNQSAAIYPVFFFAITVIALFLLVRSMFIDKLGVSKASIIALLSSLLFSVIPSLVPRTIAGIPEKESAAFFFLFMVLYLFIIAWKSKNKYVGYGLAFAAGLFTLGMALVWGGYTYIFVILGIAGFISFILGKMTKDKVILYAIWLLSASILMTFFSSRYDFNSFLTSITTGVAFVTLLISIVHVVIYNTKLKHQIERIQFAKKLPAPVVSLIVSVIVGIVLSSVFFGPGFIFEKLQNIFNTLVQPTADRLGVTVAENRQPYFREWSNSFGPSVQGIPVFFWLFVVGSIVLFYNTVNVMKKKDRIVMSIAYVLFLFAIIFSRYSQSHILNGDNSFSFLVYFGGIALFFIAAAFYYNKYFKEGSLNVFRKIDFGIIILLTFFVIGIISARGAVRLIMILGIPTAIIVSYFVVYIVSKAFSAKDEKDSLKKLFVIAVALLIVLSTLFAAYQFYRISENTGRGFIPSAYNQQWQRAMSWVRADTDQNAVFGHWWDYGYWVQSIGERATILDGGNAKSYWNHMMGRYALTGPDERKALEFLYAHNGTHFLIDSTDIGKYTAFSSIGSDAEYDRRSWISTFNRDNSQVFEAKNSTIFIYRGGTVLDGDVLYRDNGTNLFIPGVSGGSTSNSNVGAVGGFRVQIDSDGELLQPYGFFLYQGRQHELPLRYAYRSGEFFDFGSGVEAGIVLLDKVGQHAQGVQFEEDGALLYLSDRVVKSQLARLYLYGEETEYFKVAHIEDDFLVANLKAQGADIDSIIVSTISGAGGLRGPIKIWEVSYPDDIEFNPEFISAIYPEDIRQV